MVGTTYHGWWVFGCWFRIPRSLLAFLSVFRIVSDVHNIKSRLRERSLAGSFEFRVCVIQRCYHCKSASNFPSLVQIHSKSKRSGRYSLTKAIFSFVRERDQTVGSMLYNFALTLWFEKTRSSLWMGKLTSTVLQWRSFEILKGRYVLNRLLFLNLTKPNESWKELRNTNIAHTYSNITAAYHRIYMYF